MGTTAFEPPRPLASTEQWLDSSPDAVLIVDAAGLIRMVNTRAEALFGYGRAELVGQPSVLLVPERCRTDVDITARRRDGTEFPVDVVYSLLETDDERFISVAVRNSSARGTIEARLPSSQAASQLAAIVESSADAMVGKTLDGVITSWNAGAERLYGYTSAEILGRNVSEIMPADRPGELAALLVRVSRGEHVARYETKRVRKDGTILDVAVTIAPIRDPSGVVTGASTTARDLTDTRRAQAEKRELEAQLHQAQRLESLGQLAGGVAHDFNNLLAGIMNYAGLASESLQEEMSRRGLSEDPPLVTVVDDLGEITSVAKRAAALTRQLLIFGRREVVRTEVLDVNVIVGEMEDLLRRTIGENVDDLRIELTPDLPMVKADRGQLEQLIMNLAVNARDAMPDGGELAIETATFHADEQFASLREIQSGTYVQLNVSDTGVGMTQGVTDRAFDPFFTTKPKGKGTGLGLATVYGIVVQAGGHISMYSEPGLGTTVRVYLPVTSEAPEAPDEEQPDVALWAKGETVLLIEDEDIVREPTRRMLERHGYAVFAASGAEEGLAIVRAHPGTIDLLLTDVVMPGRSGRELAEDMVELRPATKVLFMSGYSQDVMVHQEVLEQDVNLIEKPFSADDLLRRVRDALDHASQAR